MPTGEPPTDAHVTYSRQYRRCRKPGCAVCGPDSPGHGPYWFAYWRQDGKLHSHYLGKRAPPGQNDAVVDTEAPAASTALPMAPAGRPVPGSHESAVPHTGCADGSAAVVRRALRIQTLGGLAVWRGTARLPVECWRPKILALLTCLLSAPGCRMQREAVMEALWPDAAPELATRNLAATMHLLRSVLDAPHGAASALRLTGDTLAVIGDAPPEDWLDAAAFAHAATAGLHGDRCACRAALERYGGEYLPEMPYAEWTVARREEVRGLHVAVLLHLADLSKNAGDDAEAERCLRLVLTADPCYEDAASTLIGILAAQGRRAEALRAYQALATALETDLGLVPSEAVETLRAGLQEQTAELKVPNRPPRAPIAPRVGNLPVPAASFIGRAWEMDEIGTTLTRPVDRGGTRLLTLVGTGGCGKTRLALAVAGRLNERDPFPDGAWLVELAALREGALVAQAVATALRLRDEGGALHERMRAFLEPRRLLLLLDNCEQVVDRCALLVAKVLATCPGVCVLATSRVPLAIPGEVVWRLSPLAVPPPAQSPRAADLGRYEAAQLFLARAQAARPGFMPSDEQAADVALICRRLDGLPLAIELAAARLGSLPLASIVARLDDRFALLRGGNRAALPRQRTLQATMDWSYALLAEPEQVLLRRLAVFSGGWTIDAATAVCAEAEQADVTESLAGLVSRSLVEMTDRQNGMRFALLETVREYAYAHLVAADEALLLHERHRAWYIGEVEKARAGWLTPERDRWLDRLATDLDNLRAALAWSAGRPGDGAATLQLAGGLAPFWLARGYLSEGRHWLEMAMATGVDAPAALRAQALSGLGSLANEQGDSRQALACFQESVMLFRVAGDASSSARALNNQGTAAKHLGDFTQALALYEEANGLFQVLGDRQTRSIVLNNLGSLYLELGEPCRAVSLLEEALIVKRELGNVQGVLAILNNLGEAARLLGDSARAGALYAEQLSLAERLGDKAHLAVGRYNLGLIAHEQGEMDRAARLFAESLTIERELGNKRHIAQTLEALAAVAVARGEGDRALRLLGAAAAMREGIGAPVPPVDRTLHDRNLDAARALLGPRASAAWDAGRQLGLEASIAEALGTVIGSC